MGHRLWPTSKPKNVGTLRLTNREWKPAHGGYSAKPEKIRVGTLKKLLWATRKLYVKLLRPIDLVLLQDFDYLPTASHRDSPRGETKNTE